MGYEAIIEIEPYIRANGNQMCPLQVNAKGLRVANKGVLSYLHAFTSQIFYI